jgi:hypothetical protein
MVDKKLYRTRRTSLLDRLGEPLIGHARIAPYSSQILRVRLFHGDVDNFHKMAELASLPRIQELSHAVFDASRRDLFSQKHLERLESWLCTLPWPVAFQCQALLSNGFLNPPEILHELRPNVAELLKGEHTRCVDILRHLAVVIKRDLDNNTLTSSCSTLFNIAKKEFDRAEARTLLRVLSDSDHMCAQVESFSTSPFAFSHVSTQGHIHTHGNATIWSIPRQEQQGSSHVPKVTRSLYPCQFY